ncbi:MAG: ABC transporter permease subunit [Clostridia bacterium]|nr:ABC transporter permease subunit [Clostridia bacterium]
MIQHGQLGARQHKVWLRMKRDWQLYLFVLLPVAYYIVFHYMPIYGIQIAFKNYKLAVGIEGSPWIGLENFSKFFSSYSSWRLITNTLLLNLYGLLVDFPIPIFIALMLNRISSERYKKFTQTVIYIPHFISTVVMAGMLYIMLDTSGVINTMITKLGGPPIAFMAEAKWFRTVYIASGEWQSAGWNTILYIAALTSVDPQIYEASTIDGATIWQKIRYIDIPSVAPIAMMMLILNSGRLLGGDSTKALLLQTAGNTATSDVIGVYVYNIGLTQGQFSYTAAIGLFQNVISFVMVAIVNTISKRISSIGMF